jgi:adenine-specific DNA-methyltransferase
MAAKHTRLELTWIGKEERPRLEPRILLEDPELSYHAEKRIGYEDIFDNLLIHGDNLLALKALEQDYSGAINCIYIDPPFNTGQAFEHYDDGVEHSLWLTLMRDRLSILHKLLAKDGTLFVHIDDNELGYLTVLLDEIFGRINRAFTVTFKQGAATGHKAINPGCVSTSNFILIYAKDKTCWKPNRIFTSREERDTRYNQFIINLDSPFAEWEIIPLAKAFAVTKGIDETQARRLIRQKSQEFDNFFSEHLQSVVRLARPDYNSVSKEARAAIDKSRENPDEVYHLPREDHKDFYFLRGERILFYRDKLKEIDGQLVSGEPLTTIWDDILSNNLHNEGNVNFPKGKKPEALIKRVIELATKSGDIVLDSFGGSGTTGAVAHKLHRRWIMIELGEHCLTHIHPRLCSLIDGRDSSGITTQVNWQGGGGFRYCNLAPSLLEKDKWGNWVVSKQYNPEMLAEAMCKLEGFRYAPDPDVFWIHGQSTETDLIYVTTQNLSQEQLQFISDQVGNERTLLICCSAFRANPDDFANLTLKKIPQAVLHRCEWGRDDYSLNVNALPDREPEPDQNNEESAESMASAEETSEAVTPRPATRRGRPRRRRSTMQELPLFASLDQGGDA